MITLTPTIGIVVGVCGESRLAPTAPRIRVERCIAGWDAVRDTTAYAPGWLVIYGDGGSDWCSHDDWDTAMTCALERARARALGLLGRW